MESAESGRWLGGRICGENSECTQVGQILSHSKQRRDELSFWKIRILNLFELLRIMMLF